MTRATRKPRMVSLSSIDLLKNGYVFSIYYYMANNQDLNCVIDL